MDWRAYVPLGPWDWREVKISRIERQVTDLLDHFQFDKRQEYCIHGILMAQLCHETLRIERMTVGLLKKTRHFNEGHQLDIRFKTKARSDALMNS